MLPHANVFTPWLVDADHLFGFKAERLITYSFSLIGERDIRVATELNQV